MIKSVSTRDFLSKFSKIGHVGYIAPPNRFLVIGEEILVLGSLSQKVKKSDCICFGKTIISNTETSITTLFNRADTLGKKLTASFSASKSLIKRIKILSKELNSTHVRIFSHEDRGVVARLFDIRIGSDVLLPRIKRIHASATLNFGVNTDNQFSITLSCDALSLIPSEDLFVSIYSDGILTAEPTMTNLEQTYVCRDQQLHEPYTSFNHERLNRTVYFVSHPHIK
jgi:hypothetical protein